MIVKESLLLVLLFVCNLSSSQPQCLPITEFVGIQASTDTDVCMLQSDLNCTEHPLCPSSRRCDECACLFNETNCPNDYCINVAVSLGLNCSSTDGILEYFAAVLNGTHNVETDGNVTECLLERVCHCLSRNANHRKLLEAEEICRLLCVMPDTSDTMSSWTGTLNGNDDVCDQVHSQYCRRHRTSGRPTECASVCVQEDSCERLIEGIMENDFEGNDFDSAMAVMSEFRLTGSHPRHARDILKVYRGFFGAIERNMSTVISHLNNTNSEILMSLLDDLLSLDRLEQWKELQQELEDPGQEVVERIETISDILAENHQLRPAILQLQNFQYIGTNIAMNVDCQGNPATAYEHVFYVDGIPEAALLLPASANSVDSNNCNRVISAALSSNLGDFVTNTSNDTQVNSDIMTVTAMEAQEPVADVQVTFHSLNANETNATCVFWNATEGQWSTTGVTLMSENSTHYTCLSTHLTTFAVLVSARSVQDIPSIEKTALSIVTYIGCSVSIVCLLLTLILLVVLRKVLNKGVLLYVHFNLLLALLLALIVFVSGIESAVHITWLCTTVAAVLHYLFLCVFCWMLAEGILLYVLIVRTFSKAFEKWYYLLPLGWGAPIPIIAVTVGLRHKHYGTTTFCWLSVERGVIWSFTGPMLAVILVNTVILVLTVGTIIRVKKKAAMDCTPNNIGLIITSVKNTVVLLPLLGITWIIGLFAVNENTTVFSWIFTILNSLQGVMIFVLHILKNKRAWNKLTKMCSRNRFITKHTSSSKMSNQPESGIKGEINSDSLTKQGNSGTSGKFIQTPNEVEYS